MQHGVPGLYWVGRQRAWLLVQLGRFSWHKMSKAVGGRAKQASSFRSICSTPQLPRPRPRMHGMCCTSALLAFASGDVPWRLPTSVVDGSKSRKTHETGKSVSFVHDV